MPTLVILSLLLSLLSLAPVPSTAAGAQAGRIHPLLSKLIDDNPNGSFRVIVMGNKGTDKLGPTIAQWGGKENQEMPLVRGVTTEMSASDIRALAKHPDVNWLTIDAPMKPTVDPGNLATDYPLAVNAPTVWNGAVPATGAGVTVAVIDSGIQSGKADFGDPATDKSRIVAGVKVSAAATSTDDGYGHGTHVAGIIGGNGTGSGGKYIGIAPQVNLLNLKVSDDRGAVFTSDVIKALEWVVKNRAAYNIRVVNISLVSGMAEPYATSPLDAAVEMTWLSGITVVVSAGNLGPDTMNYAPANDPLVITVGAADTNGTATISDDSVPAWSSYGRTQAGFNKPEVVAPGRRIVSNLSSRSAELAKLLPDRIVDQDYLRLSGTSMAAPVVSGIAALALQAHPHWTPDQVKDALVGTARPLSSPGAGAGEVDAARAVGAKAVSPGSRRVHLNRTVAGLGGKVDYDSATWNSATWNSATWNIATWNSATWNSATWNSATLNHSALNSATWNSATWNSATWNNAAWNSATWNSATWNSATWNSATWNSATWNSFPD